MTIYQKLTISGKIVDVDNSTIIKTLGDINSSSKFTATINNYTGRHIGSYSIGDEVVIYSDRNINPPTTQIFLGILESIDLKGREETEQMKLSGRDYSARLIDRTVEPEVYNNIPAGSIINDIITKYTDDITTTNVSSGLNVDRIVFNHTPVFDAIKQLAEFNNYMFYIDNSKDLHFKEKATTSSGYTFGSGGTPIIKTSFKERRDEIYNEVWVYGDRYLDGYTETFNGNQGTSGTIGSIFTLGYKPSNTSITIQSIAVQPGAIYQMALSIGSNVKYLVNYDDKQIIFTSGTQQGNNNPANGESVVVDYMRDLPIVKYGDNDVSIDIYGRRIKVIQDTSIKDPLTAETILFRELEEYSDPLKQGKLDIKNVANLTPGETCIVNIPSYDINNVTYDILEARYDFNKRRMLTDAVLSIKVNKKIPDITDTLKQILLDQKKIQSRMMQDSDLLTRYKTSTGSFGIRASGIEIYTRGIGSSFILSHMTHGLLGSYASHNLGDSRLSSILQWSGGYW